MDTISVDELHNRFETMNDNHLILDVRTPEEFSEGHIKGAKNTPHEEVGSIVDELRNYQTVYVHCKMGGRAKIASETLINSGLDNIICVGDGGMERWKKMGWPVDKG